MTFPILRNYVDQSILVTEQEIERAMIRSLEHQQMYLEGAGASTIAAIKKLDFPPKTQIVGIITAQNIAFKKFLDVINRKDALLNTD